MRNVKFYKTDLGNVVAVHEQPDKRTGICSDRSAGKLQWDIDGICIKALGMCRQQNLLEQIPFEDGIKHFSFNNGFLQWLNESDEFAVIEEKPAPEIEYPKRRFEITIKIGADTWKDAQNELDFLVLHLDEKHGPKCNSIMGGCSANHLVDIEERPWQTPEKYREQLLECRHQIDLKKKRGELK